MKIYSKPTKLTIEFSPEDYWIKVSDEKFNGEYMLVNRIDMSYKGKDDQEGPPALYLSDSGVQMFRNAGFSEIV
jgi:hypothetical protein